MADIYVNALTQLSTEPTSTDSIVLVNRNTNEGQIIDYSLLADKILEKLRTKIFSNLTTTSKVVTGAINELDGDVGTIQSTLAAGDGTGFADMQWRMKHYRIASWSNVFLFRKETGAMFIYIPWFAAKKSGQTVSMSVDAISVEYNDTAGNKRTISDTAPTSIDVITEHTVRIRMPIDANMSTLTSQVGVCTIATSVDLTIS